MRNNPGHAAHDRMFVVAGRLCGWLRFCATGQSGLRTSLAKSSVSCSYQANPRRTTYQRGHDGMGEPLANFDNVMALRLNDHAAIAMGLGDSPFLR